MTRRHSTARHWPWIATLRQPSRDSRGSSRRRPDRHSPAAMSQGLGALAAGNLDEAGAAFERAGRIRPGAPEVQDGLAQVARARGDAGITTHLAAAERAEREERWQTALEAYRQALAIDPNLLAAQEGAERAEPRAAIEAQLNGYAARPERLFSTEVRAAARATLHQARSINPAGPVLRGQIDKVDSTGGVCGSASRRLPQLRQPDRRYDLPHRADWHVRSQGHGATARALHDRRNAFRVPGRAARGDGAAGADAASGRDTMRGTDLSAQLIIREPLGERRLNDEALPMSIGGPGSDVIVPAACPGAAGMDRRAGRAALSAARIDRGNGAPQRRANRRLHVAA